MISSTHDLPPRGNYFAEADYLTQDLGAGTIHNRAGARMLALEDDFLVEMCNTLERELGDSAADAIKDIGRDWGVRAAEQFAREMESHYGRPLMQLPLAMFTACLTEAFRHHGWGAVGVDFGHYPQGLLAVEVGDPVVGGSVRDAGAPVEGLLAGFLAGMFSHFAGVELDCLQTECQSLGHARSRFLLTVPERLEAAAELRADGRSHEEIVEELRNT